MDRKRSKEGIFAKGNIGSTSQGNSTFKSHKIADINSSITEIRRNEAKRVMGPNPLARKALSSKPTSSKWADAQKWIVGPRPNLLVTRGVKNRKGTSVHDIVEEESDEGEDLQWQQEKDATKPACIDQSTITFFSTLSNGVHVPMRDMGTEMTPATSQEPSRATTPIRAATLIKPRCQSMDVNHPDSITAAAAISIENRTESNRSSLPCKAPQVKTWTDLIFLAVKLGKTSINNWVKRSLDSGSGSSEDDKGVFELRAAMWKEAEDAKSIARFRREELKIQVWRTQQNAKIEAEMKGLENEVERKKRRAQEKLMRAMARANREAEVKRSAAERKRNTRSTKAAKDADHIRRTGRLPLSIYCWNLMVNIYHLP